MNLRDPKLYQNRELSWLRFNTKVLEEAMDSKKPLLERLKFIAIYGTNLDEFYMVRVAGLKKLFAQGITVSGIDKLTPMDQLTEIRRYLHEEKQKLEATFKQITDGLNKEKLFIKNYEELNATQKKKVETIFFSHLYPVVIPIAVDATHPFPHLNNLSFGIVVKIQDQEIPGMTNFGLVRIPRSLPRFIEVDHGTYCPVGNAVAQFIDRLFPGFELLGYSPFRVTRNADMAIEEEEADDFMEIMEEGLKLRKKGEIVRLEIGKDADREVVDFLNKYLHVAQEDIYAYEMPLNMGAFWQIVGNKTFAFLTSPGYNPKTLPPLDANIEIFSILDKEDVCMYHPYESFDPVVKFVQDAARNPNTLSIRMTLYRVGKNSPIVKALMDAAENGIQVTALVELKARFDEENNLIWAKALENAGAHVIYGVPGLKVHAKIAFVILRENGQLKEYVHLATGNYNPSTSKIYTDISYMTSRKEMTDDATRFFHHLTGFTRRAKLDTLFMAPTQIKPKLIKEIENEAKQGANGRVIAKVNSLIDADIIQALYKASNAGVKVDLIVRGICGLKPGITGVSENIRVISIVGKYLEHARIFYFKHAEPQLYIASADWMPRNLERRVELMTPIMDENIAEKLYGILQLQISDNVNARVMLSNGDYERAKPEKSAIDSQKMMEDYINSLHESIKKEDSNKAKKLATRLFKDS